MIKTRYRKLKDFIPWISCTVCNVDRDKRKWRVRERGKERERERGKERERERGKVRDKEKEKEK